MFHGIPKTPIASPSSSTSKSSNVASLQDFAVGSEGVDIAGLEGVDVAEGFIGAEGGGSDGGGFDGGGFDAEGFDAKGFVVTEVAAFVLVIKA